MNSYRSRMKVLLLLALLPLAAAGATFSRGDLVRLTRGETLMKEGKRFVSAAKGQEFTVLQQDGARGSVAVVYVEESGSPISVTLPADALEPSPPTPWLELLRGVEAFRDQRWEESRRLLARAAQDAQLRPLAAPLSLRIAGGIAASGARATFASALPGLRESAAQLKAATLFYAKCRDGIDAAIADDTAAHAEGRATQKAFPRRA